MSEDKVFEVPSTAKVTMDDLNDIFICAIEQGVGYWAFVRNYEWDREIATAEIKEQVASTDEKPRWKSVSAMDILEVLPIIKDHSGQAKGWNVNEIVENHDADIADIAMQLVVFGEVIYG